MGTLQTDNGGKYLSREFGDYLKGKGIKHELTVPHFPQQNGVTEHMNRVDDVKMDFVQQALLHDESKQGSKNESTKNESALTGCRKKKFSETRTCFKCGSVGHIHRNCPEEKPKKYPKRTHRAEVGKTHNSDSEAESGSCVFTISEGNVKEMSQVDEPESIALGDGRVVQALGSGNVHVNMLLP